MRKQTKLVAVLSAAALLAIGASMTSFAAQGWAEEDGTWVYYDKDGDRVTDTWKKSGSQFFYLNEDGEMATSVIVEDGTDKYYVDENGAKVTKRWVALDNEDDEEINGQSVDTIWYYFDGNGKAYRDKNKTIDGKKYFFTSDGYMMSDWHTEGDQLYYLGDENEGWAYTGWHSLEPEDSDTDAYDDTEWFYFSSAGKAKKNTRSYINKKYYAFDENGVMLNKWIVGTPPAADRAFYNGDSGYQETGWIYVYEKGDDGKIDEDGDERWFYLDSKGMPFNELTDDEKAVATATSAKKDNEKWKGEESGAAAKMIKSKTYLFNADGEMQTGVFRLTDVKRSGSTAPLDGIYYFNKSGGSVEGQMVTGKATVSYDGDNYYYYFAKDGKAYENTIADGALYGANGERVNADDGNSYNAVMLADVVADDVTEVAIKGKTATVSVDADTMVVVSSSGKIKQSGTVTIEGTKYTISAYKVTKTEDK